NRENAVRGGEQDEDDAEKTLTERQHERVLRPSRRNEEIAVEVSHRIDRAECRQNLEDRYAALPLISEHPRHQKRGERRRERKAWQRDRAARTRQSIEPCGQSRAIVLQAREDGQRNGGEHRREDLD